MGAMSCECSMPMRVMLSIAFCLVAGDVQQCRVNGLQLKSIAAAIVLSEDELAISYRSAYRLLLHFHP